MDEDELIAYLGEADAADVLAWARRSGRKVQVPSQPWQGKGFTAASLSQLFVSVPGEETRMVVVKRLPPDHADEPVAHRKAIREAPKSFRRHFVQQVFDPFRTADGGALTFQELAGDSLEWRPLADLPSERLAEACEVVTRSLIGEWNPDFTVHATPVRAVLSARRTDVEALPELVGIDGEPVVGPWLQTDDGLVLLDPRKLHTDESLFGAARVDLVRGRIHGDLHDLNLLLHQGRRQQSFDTFVLVDLMSYRKSADLGRDPIRMLLSVVGRLLAGLTPPQQSSLVTAVVRPDSTPPPNLPPVPPAIVTAVYNAAALRLRRLSAEVWRRQYLLSLITEGLAFTTFPNLGHACHWWMFRLAGHAASELLQECGIPATPPPNAPVVADPFAPLSGAARPVSRELPRQPTAPAEPAPRVGPAPYTQAQRREVCGQLGKDWADLADHFGARGKLGRDRSAFGLWGWLAAQGRLAELPAALRLIGRSDLAAILEVSSR